jgi:hypothetical protein
MPNGGPSPLHLFSCFSCSVPLLLLRPAPPALSAPLCLPFRQFLTPPEAEALTGANPIGPVKLTRPMPLLVSLTLLQSLAWLSCAFSTILISPTLLPLFPSSTLLPLLLALSHLSLFLSAAPSPPALATFIFLLLLSTALPSLPLRRSPSSYFSLPASFAPSFSSSSSFAFLSPSPALPPILQRSAAPSLLELYFAFRLAHL